MTLAQKACEVLIGAQPLDFWLGGLHINFAALQQVRGAIEAGRIRVAVDANPDHAEYDKHANRILLPSADFTNPLVKGITVHEAVHAYCDLARAVATSPLSEEVAAYLAQTIYLRNVIGATIAGARPADTPIFDAATGLCYSCRLFSQPGARLRRADYESLRTVISHHPLYASYASRSANDGVPE